MRRLLTVLVLLLLAGLWGLLSRRGPEGAARRGPRGEDALALPAPTETEIEDPAPALEARATRAPVAPASPERAAVDEAEGRFHGLVRDAFGGQPIVGALVHLDENGAGGSALEEDEVRSDALGRFVLPTIPPGTFVTVRVTAAGFAPHTFFLGSGHDTPQSAAVLELLPVAEAALEVRVRSLDGRALEGAKVEVHWPDDVLAGPARVSFGGAKEIWRARTDPSGLAFFGGLVAEEELLWKVGTEALAGREGSVVLAPGRTENLEVVLDSGVVLRGCARDENGLPIAGLAVGLKRVGVFLRVDTVAGRGPLAKTLTDAAGRFEFPDLACGTVRFDLGPEQEEFLLPDDAPLVLDRPVVEHDLALLHGRFLEGVVVGQGIGQGHADTVFARQVDGDATRERSMEGAEFRLGPLALGAYDVSAFGVGWTTETRQVLAGTSGLELHRLDSREVVVRIEGSSGWGQIGHAGENGVEEFEGLSFPTEGGVTTCTLSLPFGTHSLFASSTEGRVGFLGDLRIGAEEPPGEVLLRMRPGIPCTLVHRAGPARGELRLRLDGAPLPRMFLVGEGLAPGASRTLWLPPGALEAELLVAGRVIANETRALRSGGSYRIELSGP